MNVKKNSGSWAEFYDVLKCDLSSYLPKIDQKDIKQRFFIAWRIAKGIRILQEHSIIHGDLKPDNILIDYKNQPLIADFDTIQFLNDGQVESNQNLYTVRWASPELLGSNKINFGTDIWSFGCILIYLFSGV